jgi:hypothetical protein
MKQHKWNVEKRNNIIYEIELLKVRIKNKNKNKYLIKIKIKSNIWSDNWLLNKCLQWKIYKNENWNQ